MSPTPRIPTNYPRVCPRLFVPDADAAIAFYVGVFAATEPARCGLRAGADGAPRGRGPVPAVPPIEQAGRDSATEPHIRLRFVPSRNRYLRPARHPEERRRVADLARATPCSSDSPWCRYVMQVDVPAAACRGPDPFAQRSTCHHAMNGKWFPHAQVTPLVFSKRQGR